MLKKGTNEIKSTSHSKLDPFTGNKQKAREIVEFTDRPITEIAYYCGFGSVRNFNRVFASVYGFSPSDLRKNKNACEK